MNKETIWVHCPVCGNIKGLERKTQNGRENHVVGKAGNTFFGKYHSQLSE